MKNEVFLNISKGSLFSFTNFFSSKKKDFRKFKKYMLNIISVEATQLLLICVKYMIVNFLNYHFDNTLL
jgi:purine-nucleoside phosphorylase